jgi:superfamily I DNA/RNA helicase
MVVHTRWTGADKVVHFACIYPMPSIKLADDMSQAAADGVAEELKEAVDRILASSSTKKLVVAGPGAGKTTLFRQMLDASKGAAAEHLVITFINNLKSSLEKDLGDVAEVFTLHGYCQHLLHKHEQLRNGLGANFKCYPGLVSLIKTDWEWLKDSSAPQFVKLMRDLDCSTEQEEFYVQRANYYNAVDFDDSVYRTHKQLVNNSALVPKYKLVLVDEFQDFNKMEAGIIDRLANENSIVVAGDDDQALYGQLRDASWDHIRARYLSGHYDIFELPFCMRCPEVIVGAVNDVIAKARKDKKLQGRIEKPFRYFEPVKGEDSKRFPKIGAVETTVQRGNANYFGRYIEQCIRAISPEEIELAQKKNEPAALIIGSNPYRRQVEEHLIEVGLVKVTKQEELTEIQQAYELLNGDPNSNLGWRIMFSVEDQGMGRKIVTEAADARQQLSDLIPDDYRQVKLQEAKKWIEGKPAEGDTSESAETAPAVKITSFEGSKGMSAQYVFIIGLQSGDMPRNASDVQDIEICKFLVGLTRTKRKCEVVTTARFGNVFKQPSEFLTWIDAARFAKKKIDKTYWND